LREKILQKKVVRVEGIGLDVLVLTNGAVQNNGCTVRNNSSAEQVEAKQNASIVFFVA